MGANPLNLALRFILELTALSATGMWGWKQSDSWLRFLLVIGIPIMLAVIWGVFNVPGDPSRSGEAPIVTPGIIRLLIELSIFAFSTWALYDLGYLKSSVALGIIIGLHYIVSYDRIAWLLNQ